MQRQTAHTSEFEFLGNYRVTYHKGSELIEVEEWTWKKSFFGSKKWYWKKIYMGHPERLEKSIELYNKLKSING